MRAQWLVAKFIPDLRRREPVNVGLLLFVDSQRVTRFLGQRADGEIDGRRARWTDSLENYQAWVRYWRHRVAQEAPLSELLSHRSDDSFYLEFSGERIVGDDDLDAITLADHLFELLVDTTGGELTISLERVAEHIFGSLGIRNRIHRNYEIEVAIGKSAVDRVRFDYRYDNGTANLMQRVSLLGANERSWKAAHSAAWSFERALEQLESDAPQGAQFIALIRSADKTAETTRQVHFLRELAEVVDMGHTSSAERELRGLLHV